MLKTEEQRPNYPYVRFRLKILTEYTYLFSSLSSCYKCLFLVFPVYCLPLVYNLYFYTCPFSYNFLSIDNYIPMLILFYVHWNTEHNHTHKTRTRSVYFKSSVCFPFILKAIARDWTFSLERGVWPWWRSLHAVLPACFSLLTRHFKRDRSPPLDFTLK